MTIHNSNTTDPNNTNIFSSVADQSHREMDMTGDSQDGMSNTGDVNYTETLVGDGKKYSSVEQLAKAYAHLNRFTERIKEENSGLRAELGSKVSLEELVNKLANNQQQTASSMNNSANPTSASNQNANNEYGERQNSDSGRGFSQAEVAELVRKSITEEQTRALQAQNRQLCVDELKRSWGSSEYLDKLKEVQRALGTSPEALDNLAATSPQLFLNAVLGGNRSNQPAVSNPNAGIAPRSSVNAAASDMRSSALPKEDWRYFEKLRTESPAKYWSPSVQNRMHELALKGLLNTPER